MHENGVIGELTFGSAGPYSGRKSSAGRGAPGKRTCRSSTTQLAAFWWRRAPHCPRWTASWCCSADARTPVSPPSRDPPTSDTGRLPKKEFIFSCHRLSSIKIAFHSVSIEKSKKKESIDFPLTITIKTSKFIFFANMSLHQGDLSDNLSLCTIYHCKQYLSVVGIMQEYLPKLTQVCLLQKDKQENKNTTVWHTVWLSPSFQCLDEFPSFTN